MADIGTLVVRMAADSARMMTELDKVKKELGMTSRAVSTMNKNLSSIKGKIAGAFTLAAVTAFAANVVQAADALQDMSEKLGMSAANLSVMQLAATQSGGSVDGISVALQKMTLTMGDALAGQKSAVQAFDSLGLSFSELSTLAPDEAFRRIAERLGEVDSVYTRAALAQDIFGKGAKDIAGLLADGGSAIDDVGARLDQLGARLTDLDVAKIAMMKDEAAFAGVAFSNLATKVLGNAAPAMGVLLQSFNNVLESMGGASAAGRGFGIAMTALIKGIESVAQLTYGVFETLRGFVYKVAADALDVAGIFSSSARATAQAWQATANGAFANANRANDAALQAGRDMFNAASVFDAEATRMEQRATAAAAAAQRSAAAMGAAAAAGAAASGAAAGGKKGAPTKPEMSPADRRAAADAEMAATLSLDAGLYQAKELALDQHLLNVAMAESQSAIERMHIASDLEYFRADVAEAFGLQTLDFETIKNQSVLDLAGELFTALGGESSKLFKIQKTFAIANAIIGTAEGITQALKLPFPANLAAAAKVAAAGAIQIAKIKATNPGGGGGASPSISGGGGGGGAAGQALPDRVPALEQQAPQRIAQVVVQGNLFSGRETADWLIEQLSDAVNNRDVVFINGASRQAGAISESA